MLATKQEGKEGQLAITETSAPKASSSVLAANKLRIKQKLQSILCVNCDSCSTSVILHYD